MPKNITVGYTKALTSQEDFDIKYAGLDKTKMG